MAIGTPIHGGAAAAPDPGDYVLRSGVRSGHKREFAFALRSQADSHLPRTRSGRSPAPIPIPIPIHNSIPKKRTKRSPPGDEIADAASSDAPQEPAAKAPMATCDVAESLIEVPGHEIAGASDGQNEAHAAIPMEAPIAIAVEGQGEADEETGDVVWLGRPVKKRLMRSELKATMQIGVAETPTGMGEEGSVLENAIVIEDDEPPGSKATTEGGGGGAESKANVDESAAAELGANVDKSAAETIPMDSVPVAVEIPVVHGDNDGSICESPALKGIVLGLAAVLKVNVDGDGESKKQSSQLEKPTKRLARSVISKDKVDLSVCDLKGSDVDSGVTENPGKLLNVDSNTPEKPDRVINADVCTPENCDNVPSSVGSSVQEKPSRRFTRSALKAPLIEEDVSMVEAPVTVEDHVECKMDNSVPKKLTIRFIRSAVKPPVESRAETESSESSDASEGTKSGDKSSGGSLRTTLKKKMELKMSKKITLTKLPSNVRDLLTTGFLEGYPVKYTCSDKQVGLEGIIRGNTIVCYCASCKGSKAFSAFNFEVHAGSTKKHPSDYIFLENGKSLRDVLKACTSAPLDMLEATIQNVIGAVPPKRRPSFCQKCGESSHTSHTGETALLCDSCLNVKQPQTIASTSHGTSSNAKLSRAASIPDSFDSASKSISSSNKKNTFGKITKKDLGLHKLVFDILPEGTEVAYYHEGKRLHDGYIKDSGIFCLCFGTVVSPSQFEAHAGRASRRKPFHNIYTSNGVSLHELSVSLSKARKLSTSENDDLCGICSDGGNLLLCDLCPRAFHKDCLGLAKHPKGDWYCPNCQSMHHREDFVARNNNAIAAGRVAGVDPIEQIIKRCIRIVTSPGADIGGCVLCRLHDFSKSTFDERTVLICDQCEKEYHVGCLRDHNMCDLKELPEEEWFCCADCSRIHTALQELLLRGPEPLQDLDADIIRKKCDEKGSSKGEVDVRWRLLSGKTASADSELLISGAISLFSESFDPIVEAATGRDLIPIIVNGENIRDQDFGGVYCAVLTVNSSVVSAGILRIFGCELAELPLVATSTESQGQGYFQSLFSCIERLLGSLNIKHFVLPAAEEALSIWTKKFGFTKIAPDQLIEYSKGIRTMTFQGTSMLYKLVPGSQVSSRGNQ